MITIKETSWNITQQAASTSKKHAKGHVIPFLKVPPVSWARLKKQAKDGRVDSLITVPVFGGAVM